MSEDIFYKKFSSETYLDNIKMSLDGIDKINKIISIYKIHLLRKKVKSLIIAHKKNYAIYSTLKENNLKLVVYLSENETKEYPVKFEKILNENIVYINRDDIKKRLLLKCYFVNSKNESIIDPKYNNEFNDGLFFRINKIFQFFNTSKRNFFIRRNSIFWSLF